MEIRTREVDGKLLVDMSGSFPRDTAERAEGGEKFKDALGGRKDFILVLHDVGSLTSRDLGTLLVWLRHAQVEMGALGSGPIVRVVSDDERIRNIFNIVDSPFIAYASEKEALLSKKSGRQ